MECGGILKKGIFEVFENLSVKSELYHQLKDGWVKQVILDQSQNCLLIQIVLPTIVYPENLRALEEVIYAFLDYPKKMEVHIEESYELSSSLEFPNLYRAFEKAMFYYIRALNPIALATLRSGEIRVLNRGLVFEVPSTGYDYIKELKLEEFIQDLFRSRFDQEVEIEILKVDQHNQIYEEFLRNRDAETKNLIRRADLLVVEEKVVVKEEDISKETYQNLIYGKKPLVGEIQRLSSFDEDTNYANIDVEIIAKMDTRELKGGKLLFKFDVTDFTDSVTCKCFVEKEEFEKVDSEIKVGKALRIRGMYKYDDFDKARLFFVNTMEKLDSLPKSNRKDNAKEKRVELHL
ncbi:MAG: hypothetical protein JW708_09285, partial [Vallitaleaceae bacterium]|nr:hypothetical protein [Vallitaleaceae bacterium]